MHKSFAFRKEPRDNTKKNIIFLDIDGVIQPYSQDSRFEYELEKLPAYFADRYNDKNFLQCNIWDLGAAYFDWDEIALARIKQILRDFNAYLVIHSGWRESVPYHCLNALFKLYDMDEYILEVLESGKKETVIQRYLEDYKDFIKQYVVIDDDAMMSDFGMNFCHTRNVFDLKDHLYVNRLFMKKYEFFDEPLIFKVWDNEIHISEYKSIYNEKTVSLFEIDSLENIDEYEVEMIFRELHRYCKNNNIWCMGLKMNTKYSDKYSLINKATAVKDGEIIYLFTSPTNNFADWKTINFEEKKIVEIFK